MPKKTWTQKFQHPPAPQVVKLDKPYGGLQEGDRLLIATPAIIAEYVGQLPKGKAGSVPRMRADLASAHDAEGTCALTAGIFLRIASELAWEQHQQGKALSKVTPFWRMVDPKSPLAKKLACGPGFIREQREREGIA